MPPEALSASSRYGPSLDVFSFGHLALFILTQVQMIVFNFIVSHACGMWVVFFSIFIITKINVDNPWILNTMIQKQCSVPICYTVNSISVTDTFKLEYIYIYRALFFILEYDLCWSIMVKPPPNLVV